jgi:hypothetical protein
MKTHKNNTLASLARQKTEKGLATTAGGSTTRKPKELME